MSEKLIFFVDDDKMIINLLEYTIKPKIIHTVKTFSSGEECLANLELNPDLIILDHILSTTDKAALTGMDTLKEIIKKKPNIPIIMLSGQEDKSLISKFIQNGAKKYIQKNEFFIDSLLEEIQKEIS
ncbi:MAG: response regulator [Bacteroidales bacterium]|nr:response regulator [Bacteroidales bacterium]